MSPGLCTFYSIMREKLSNELVKTLLTQQRIQAFQHYFPPFGRERERQATKVDEVERSEEVVRKRLGNVVLKEFYFPNLGFVFSGEFFCRDVASEYLKIAILTIADIRHGHKVKRPCTSPGGDVNNPRDMSGVNPNWDEPRIVKYTFVKRILPVQPVRDIFNFVI